MFRLVKKPNCFRYCFNDDSDKHVTWNNLFFFICCFFHLGTCNFQWFWNFEFIFQNSRIHSKPTTYAYPYSRLLYRSQKSVKKSTIIAFILWKNTKPLHLQVHSYRLTMWEIFTGVLRRVFYRFSSLRRKTRQAVFMYFLCTQLR